MEIHGGKKGILKRSRSAQERPISVQERPKDAQGPPRALPNGAQGHPKSDFKRYFSFYCPTQILHRFFIDFYEVFSDF